MRDGANPASASVSGRKFPMSADKSDPDREAKLAQALRANLRRRKAPRPPSPQEDPPGDGRPARQPGEA